MQDNRITNFRAAQEQHQQKLRWGILFEDIVIASTI